MMLVDKETGKGYVVLPNTPTVTGYASYNPCDCRNNSAQTPAA